MDSPSSFPFDTDPERLKQTLPESPGVYIFKESSGSVLYVGKAKNLKKRVLSYFRAPQEQSRKTEQMLKKASGLDFIVTSTENEAFILESNLVRKHMPRYNIVLRDDKRYPSLRLDPHEPYPRLTIARKVKKNGALYFGPFSSANAVRDTLKVIDRVFHLRKCKTTHLPRRSRPCLNHQMGLCLGPCANDVSIQEYNGIVAQVQLFLEGRSKELVHRLKDEMTDASNRQDFEKAARLRDQIKNIEKIIEKQHVSSSQKVDQDIIGLSKKKELFQIVLLLVRNGSVVGSRQYLLKQPEAGTPEVMEAFIKQYYHREAFMPKRIIISEPLKDRRAIIKWLSDMKGEKVSIQRTVRGKRPELVKMAVANAENLLQSHSESGAEELLEMAKSLLGLKKLPRVIEGIDISNIQGQSATGSSVSFVDALPCKSDYRSYRIKSVSGIDDYGMMAEVLSRRLSKGRPPDLFLIDGGKGHLASAVKVVKNGGYGDSVDIISIAKPENDDKSRTDKIFLPGRKNPLVVKHDNPVLHLLMRIRDEAHRRAIDYHRKLRAKQSKESLLEEIPGIGPKRRKILLRYFKNIDSIASAGQRELEAIPGISKSSAENIVRFFRGKEPLERDEHN